MRSMEKKDLEKESQDLMESLEGVTNTKEIATRFSTPSSSSIIHSLISALICLTVKGLDLILRAVTLELLSAE